MLTEEPNLVTEVSENFRSEWLFQEWDTVPKQPWRVAHPSPESGSQWRRRRVDYRQQQALPATARSAYGAK